MGINVLLDWHTVSIKESKTNIAGTRTMGWNIYLHQGRSLWVGVSRLVGQGAGSDSESKEHVVNGKVEVCNKQVKVEVD